MSRSKEAVIEIIKEVCLPSSPNLDDPDRPLLESGLDSLDYAGTLMALEDKYGVKVTNEDMENLKSINNIVSYLEAKAG